MAGPSFLRRTTNFAGGLSVGGGDTTWDRTPQPMLITKRLTDKNPIVQAIVPAGTILLEQWILPAPGVQPTAGTVTMIDTTNGVAYMINQDATLYQKAALATIGELTVDSRFRMQATGLSADSAVDVGLFVIPKKWTTSEAR